jgi:hypothetical protein
VRTIFLLENVKRIDHLRDLSLSGEIIVLWILRILREDVAWLIEATRVTQE